MRQGETRVPVWVETELSTDRGSDRRWLVLTLGVLCAALFAVDLAAVKSGRWAPDDRSLALQIHAAFGRGTFDFFRAVSFLGGGGVRSIVAGVVALALALGGRWWSTLLLAVATAGAGLVDSVVKDLVARPRPHLFQGALHTAGWSFPSGHAMETLVFLGILVYLLRRFTHRRGVVVIGALIACGGVGLVGLSRVVLGVHYPSDVVGGFALGGAWLGVVITGLRGLLGREA